MDINATIIGRWVYHSLVFTLSLVLVALGRSWRWNGATKDFPNEFSPLPVIVQVLEIEFDLSNNVSFAHTGSEYEGPERLGEFGFSMTNVRPCCIVKTREAEDADVEWYEDSRSRAWRS